MRARRAAAAAAGALLLAGVAGVSGATPALACTPHLNSKGPTVTIAPDYSDPTRSDVWYESDGTYVEVVTCLG